MSAHAIEVHFIPTTVDRARVAAQRERLRPPRWYRRVLVGFFSVFGVLAVGALIYAVASHIITTWPVRRIPWTAIFGWAITALSFTTLERLAIRKAFPALDPARDVDLRFDDLGITFGTLGSRVFPWKDVTGVEDVGDAFVIHGANASLIDIPKRALADGGIELWAFFFSRLVAPRGLIRSSYPQRLIHNSSGR